MFLAMRYRLYNLKNVKNTHEGVLLFSNTPPWVFSRFLNCRNDAKSRKAPYFKLNMHYLIVLASWMMMIHVQSAPPIGGTSGNRNWKQRYY